MSDLSDIMDEIGTALRTAIDAAYAGTNITVQVEPRRNFNPTPPSIDVYRGDPFRDGQASSFGDRGEMLFTVRARVSTADYESGHDILLELADDVGAASVADILESDQTLNGKTTSLKVDGPSADGLYGPPDNEGFLLGCTWLITLLPART